MNRPGILLCVSLAFGCRDRSDRASAPPPPPSPPDELAEKMRHCPVTLPGVESELHDVEGGVRVVLRANAPDVLAEARRRARVLADLAAGRSKERHGGGKGGGFMRNCPIPTKDTRVVARDLDGGVEIIVTPTDAARLAELRATARERFDRAPLPRARVVREEASDQGEVRLYAGGAADLDGDGTLELVAGGFSARDRGRRSTLLVYRQHGEAWAPLTESGWDDGQGSTVRNVELADLDGDGRPEVIALGRAGATSREAKARLAVLGLDGGKLVKRAEVDWLDGRYTHGYGLAVADLDGDRTVEIVTGGFQLEGKAEVGFVRVWSLNGTELAVRARAVLDGQGSPSMRINDLAIGDVDADGRADIVVAGRHGPLKTEHSKEHLDERRETGDLSVLAFAGGKLTTRTRFGWSKGPSLRLRSVVVADLDGDRRNEIVTGGQYGADGRSALGLFAFEHGALVLRDDASSTVDGVTGEVKDLVAARRDRDVRIIATGVMGDKPGRHGDVTAWRLDGGKLVRDSAVVSRNGEETRARAVVLVPGSPSSTVLTIGHAKNPSAMIGQVLKWELGATRR